ncbi:TPA: glycosyl transferase family 8, partial [Escherichia coli]|nr:glycosyl transferase family 8 [Escherichia coli]
IYLDSDLLIQKDITEMLSYGPIAMGNGRLTINEACGFEILDENNNHSARSSGVVIVNDSLPRYEKLTTECYQLTKKYWESLGGSPYIGPRYYWGLHGMSQTKLFNIIKSANALGVDVTK